MDRNVITSTQTPEERNKNYSAHIWAEAFGGKLGDRACVKCGTVINVFELRDTETFIPDCNPIQKT